MLTVCTRVPFKQTSANRACQNQESTAPSGFHLGFLNHHQNGSLVDMSTCCHQLPSGRLKGIDQPLTLIIEAQKRQAKASDRLSAPKGLQRTISQFNKVCAQKPFET